MGAGVAHIAYPSRRSGGSLPFSISAITLASASGRIFLSGHRGIPLKVIALALSEKEDRGIVGQNTSPERIVRSCPSNFSDWV